MRRITGLVPTCFVEVVHIRFRPYIVRFVGFNEKETVQMTSDKSLKVKTGRMRTRNVLTRAERLEKLKESDRWSEGDSVLGMPKVRVQKLALKKKKKAKVEEEDDTAVESSEE